MEIWGDVEGDGETAAVLPYLRCSSRLRSAPFRSGKQKEGPFMGRLRADFARLGNPMQDCHLRKEPALRSILWSH